MLDILLDQYLNISHSNCTTIDNVALKDYHVKAFTDVVSPYFLQLIPTISFWDVISFPFCKAIIFLNNNFHLLFLQLSRQGIKKKQFALPVSLSSNKLAALHYIPKYP